MAEVAEKKKNERKPNVEFVHVDTAGKQVTAQEIIEDRVLRGDNSAHQFNSFRNFHDVLFRKRIVDRRSGSMITRLEFFWKSSNSEKDLLVDGKHASYEAITIDEYCRRKGITDFYPF